MVVPNLAAYRPTIVEIDMNAFQHNVKQFKKLAQDVLLLAVVKTNAYGHGVLRMGEKAIEAGAERLGVTTVEEGVYLRTNGIAHPVHLLSTVSSEQVADIVKYNLIPSVSGAQFLQILNEEAVKAEKIISVHLKIDVGLHRFGMLPDEALSFCENHASLPGINFEGIYTHFSEADEGRWDVTDYQYSLFRQTVDELEEAGYHFSITHVGASTIALERPDMFCDMIRPGIALFGYTPEVRQENILSLQSVLQLKSAVLRVRTIPKNSGVGYGASFRADKERKIAIVPIGHGDGYSRALSNKGEVLVRGRRAPIIGTISLDQTFIDVTDIPNVTEGDEVVLIGKQGNDWISARDVAFWMDSIVDEVLAGILERVRRVYR